MVSVWWWWRSDCGVRVVCVLCCWCTMLDDDYTHENISELFFISHERYKTKEAVRLDVEAL